MQFLLPFPLSLPSHLCSLGTIYPSFKESLADFIKHSITLLLYLTWKPFPVIPGLVWTETKSRTSCKICQASSMPPKLVVQTWTSQDCLAQGWEHIYMELTIGHGGIGFCLAQNCPELHVQLLGVLEVVLVTGDLQAWWCTPSIPRLSVPAGIPSQGGAWEILH